MKTQGTNLYLVNPSGPAIVAVGCVTSINGVDITRDSIEKTCLETDAREYEPGIKTPAVMNFGLNYEMSTSSHTLMETIFNSGATVQWAIGLSDGTAAPTLDTNDDMDFPTSRSYITFDGFLTSLPFEFPQNEIVRTTINVQMTGDRVISRKV